MINNNIIKVILVIMGTIIGAGLASGREIYSFFCRFGSNGLIGIFISGIFLGLIIYFSNKIVYIYNINTNAEFIERINGNKYIYYTINVFLIISFYIMIAGFSGYFKQEYGINVYLSSSLLCILLYFSLISKSKGLIKINSIVSPILILIILFISIKYINFSNIENIERNSLKKSLINAILYSSYNSIILIPILITLKKYVGSNKNNIVISLLSTILIIITLFSVYAVLIKSNMNISNMELPMIGIINNKFEKNIYSFAIEIAIYTSAISAGFAIISNLNKNSDKNVSDYKKIILGMCIIGIPVSGIGFKNLVNTLYPIFGVLGLIQIALIFKIILKKSKKTDIKYTREENKNGRRYY